MNKFKSFKEDSKRAESCVKWLERLGWEEEKKIACKSFYCMERKR